MCSHHECDSVHVWSQCVSTGSCVVSVSVSQFMCGHSECQLVLVERSSDFNIYGLGVGLRHGISRSSS